MNRPAWMDRLFGSLIKKALLIVVVIATPVFAVWVAFAEDLPIPEIPTWLGLLGAVGLGGAVAWLFQVCATRLTKKKD